MKVRDLVKQLTNLPQDLEIYIYEPVSDVLSHIVSVDGGLVLDGLYYPPAYANDSHPDEIIKALDDGEGSNIAVIEI